MKVIYQRYVGRELLYYSCFWANDKTGLDPSLDGTKLNYSLLYTPPPSLTVRRSPRSGLYSNCHSVFYLTIVVPQYMVV